LAPVWISHRGYKTSAVENTAEAFRAALKVGFQALETDLRLSLDGHIVLHHDPTLARLAGVWNEIRTMTRKELERIDLVGGHKLLFLDRFFQEFPGVSWTFDIKPETGVETIRALKAMAENLGIGAWLVAQAKFVVWSTRDERVLLELFPSAQCYAKERECWRAGIALIARLPALAGIVRGRTYALPPRLGTISLFEERYFSAIHARGGRVLAFLPETDEDARKAMRLGADEILTNGRIVTGAE
jgi:glycerophosphoryl diester phosphodiesterase